MNGIVKVLTGILGVLAVIACLATIGIVGYSLIGGGNDQSVETSGKENEEITAEASAVPAQVPEGTASPEADKTPEPARSLANLLSHVHDYEESEEKKATCYGAGKIKYTCECGDTYYVDVMSTGHVAGDWENVRKPTAEREGLQVRKCIYCDEIIAQENIIFKDESGSGEDEEEEEAPHVHQYTASTEREPSCILAGLRKYTCSCGNFYTEMIPAPGHVATDWEVAAEATTTRMGTEQRTCVVCGVVLDSRPTSMLSPSPAASASQAPSAGTASSPAASAGQNQGTSASPSAAPSASPHAHYYQSYVLKEANCTEKGVRSFTCSCGSNYAESIDLDLNNHTYRSVVIPATVTTQGYTVYTCVRCNYSYFDNYSPALKN